MAEANSERELRAIAHDASQAMSLDFKSLIGNGQLAMTIEPKHGKRYQGIVSLDGDSLARCLEAYFEQSEQLLPSFGFAPTQIAPPVLCCKNYPANPQTKTAGNTSLPLPIP